LTRQSLGSLLAGDGLFDHTHDVALFHDQICKAYLAREIRALIKLSRYLNRTNVEVALERRKAC
jgi:hypothetical protein